jgi:hypothetical protein
MQGGISLFRTGVDEFYLTWGFVIARKKLEAARRDLEALGMYERCRDALDQAEVLITKGPEHDEEANLIFLNVNRALMKASGSHDTLVRRFSSANDTGASAAQKPGQ